MGPMKIHKSLLLALGIACLLVGVFYLKLTHNQTPILVIPAKEPASQSYAEAMALLNSGKNTNKAIALLKHSILAIFQETISFGRRW
jgi:hypothetical protein